MFRRAVSAVLIVVLLPQLTGCTSHYTTDQPLAEVEDPTEEEIIGVTTIEGASVEFDREDVPISLIEGDSLYAHVDGEPYVIALTDVSHLRLRRVDKAASVFATIGAVLGVALLVLAVAAGIALATKDSCPFIYSWDGERYVFDAEPYGGAITRGLERDDYGKLEYLRPDDGQYRLMITNEVRETQYTNLMELWVVDHAPGVEVVPDEHGNLYALADLRPLTSATDGSGRDLTPWLRGRDEVVWEPAPVPGPAGDLRDEITLTFPKPAAATQVRLLANAATGLWGSYMIGEMLRLRGTGLPVWYAMMDGSPVGPGALYAWNLREETYLLKLEVETDSGWQVRGLLPGGGPFISEDRVIPLEVGDVSGDRLRIRLRPPKGYWALNGFAVDYGRSGDFVVDTVAPVSAVDHTGRDVLAALLANDDSYYDMPETGDRGDVIFPAPATRPGLERTVILHSRGWYRLHLDDLGEPDMARLERLMNEPGYAAVLAAERYAAWHDERAVEP